MTQMPSPAPTVIELIQVNKSQSWHIPIQQLHDRDLQTRQRTNVISSTLDQLNTCVTKSSPKLIKSKSSVHSYQSLPLTMANNDPNAMEWSPVTTNVLHNASPLHQQVNDPFVLNNQIGAAIGNRDSIAAQSNLRSENISNPLIINNPYQAIENNVNLFSNSRSAFGKNSPSPAFGHVVAPLPQATQSRFISTGNSSFQKNAFGKKANNKSANKQLNHDINRAKNNRPVHSHLHPRPPIPSFGRSRTQVHGTPVARRNLQRHSFIEPAINSHSVLSSRRQSAYPSLHTSHGVTQTNPLSGGNNPYQLQRTSIGGDKATFPSNNLSGSLFSKTPPKAQFTQDTTIKPFERSNSRRGLDSNYIRERRGSRPDLFGSEDKTPRRRSFEDYAEGEVVEVERDVMGRLEAQEQSSERNHEHGTAFAGMTNEPPSIERLPGAFPDQDESMAHAHKENIYQRPNFQGFGSTAAQDTPLGAFGGGLQGNHMTSATELQSRANIRQQIRTNAHQQADDFRSPQAHDIVHQDNKATTGIWNGVILFKHKIHTRIITAGSYVTRCESAILVGLRYAQHGATNAKRRAIQCFELTRDSVSQLPHAQWRNIFYSTTGAAKTAFRRTAQAFYRFVRLNHTQPTIYHQNDVQTVDLQEETPPSSLQVTVAPESPLPSVGLGRSAGSDSDSDFDDVRYNATSKPRVKPRDIAPITPPLEQMYKAESGRDSQLSPPLTPLSEYRDETPPPKEEIPPKSILRTRASNFRTSNAVKWDDSPNSGEPVQSLHTYDIESSFISEASVLSSQSSLGPQSPPSPENDVSTLSPASTSSMELSSPTTPDLEETRSALSSQQEDPLQSSPSQFGDSITSSSSDQNIKSPSPINMAPESESENSGTAIKSDPSQLASTEESITQSNHVRLGQDMRFKGPSPTNAEDSRKRLVAFDEQSKAVEETQENSLPSTRIQDTELLSSPAPPPIIYRKSSRRKSARQENLEQERHERMMEDLRQKEIEEYQRVAEEAANQLVDDLVGHVEQLELIKREEAIEAERRCYRKVPTVPFIMPITEDWQQRLQKSLTGSINRVIAHTSDGTELKRRDIETLNDRCWLNDEIVNASIKQTIDFALTKSGHQRGNTPKFHSFNTFFYKNLSGPKGYSAVQRWAKKAKIGGMDIFKAHYIFIPINENTSHWTFAVVMPQLKIVEYFNSFTYQSGTQYLDNIKLWLEGELGESFIDSDWKFRNGIGPRQENGFDCGVFTATTLRAVAFGIDPEKAYSNNDLRTQRKRIACELLNGKGLAGDFEPQEFEIPGSDAADEKVVSR